MIALSRSMPRRTSRGSLRRASRLGLLSSAERLAKSSPLERVDRTLTQVEHLVGNASTSSERVFAQLESASEKLGSVLNRTDRLISAKGLTGGQPGVNQRAGQQRDK